MHELGHNFNSPHTHDTAYSPLIDTCGNTCPSPMYLESATIMSYCHLCSGSYGNMLYTFGGKYQGGSRSSAASYIKTPELVGDISTDPQRVNARMWSHVDSRGSCLKNFANQCTTDSDCDDGLWCNGVETCDGSVCTNPSPPCSGLETCNEDTDTCEACTAASIEVTIVTDNYPTETSWTLTDMCTGTQVASRSSYSGANTQYTDTYTFCAAQYDFTINDSYGDGICCSYGSGSYTIKYQGQTAATGGAFASTETKTFGSCDATPPPPPPSPTNSPTVSYNEVFVSYSYNNHSLTHSCVLLDQYQPPPTLPPTPPPTFPPSLPPTPPPTPPPTLPPTLPPTPAPTMAGYCSDGTGRCELDQSNLEQCACAARRRLTDEDEGIARFLKGQQVTRENRKRGLQTTGEAKKTPSPTPEPTTPPPTPPPTPAPTPEPLVCECVASAPTPPPTVRAGYCRFFAGNQLFTRLSSLTPRVTPPPVLFLGCPNSSPHARTDPVACVPSYRESVWPK